jgi:hypothetical protein
MVERRPYRSSRFRGCRDGRRRERLQSQIVEDEQIGAPELPIAFSHSLGRKQKFKLRHCRKPLPVDGTIKVTGAVMRSWRSGRSVSRSPAVSVAA